MTVEEKIGQLFVNMGASRTYQEESISPMRWRSTSLAPCATTLARLPEPHEQNRILQENSTIPL